MTENKRFIKKQERVHYIDDGENIFEWVIYDTSDNNKVIVYTDMEKEANICCNLLNELHEENTHIKNTIKELYQTERTQIGKNTLKQLIEAIQ